MLNNNFVCDMHKGKKHQVESYTFVNVEIYVVCWSSNVHFFCPAPKLNCSMNVERSNTVIYCIVLSQIFTQNSHCISYQDLLEQEEAEQGSVL